MATGYTYPEWYDDIQGQNYAGKLYNCAFFDMVCKLEMRYLFGAGLLFQEQATIPYFKRYG
jgi:hypothetical protein